VPRTPAGAPSISLLFDGGAVEGAAVVSGAAEVSTTFEFDEPVVVSVTAAVVVTVDVALSSFFPPTIEPMATSTATTAIATTHHLRHQGFLVGSVEGVVMMVVDAGPGSGGVGGGSIPWSFDIVGPPVLNLIRGSEFPAIPF
jgi:hypothetical protein